MLAWGLIAGVGYAQLRQLPPGLVCDLFLCRFRYDCKQHGLKEKPQEDETF